MSEEERNRLNSLAWREGDEVVTEGKRMTRQEARDLAYALLRAAGMPEPGPQRNEV
jgi:hypothetical protein